jgi:uncharacterized membrane-anchored protein YitT (DUF2179 family)
VIVAPSFGGFTILALFENKQWVFSFSWWILSIAYWFVLLGIFFTFPQWATSIWEIEHVRKLLGHEAKKSPDI